MGDRCVLGVMDSSWWRWIVLRGDGEAISVMDR